METRRLTTACTRLRQVQSRAAAAEARRWAAWINADGEDGGLTQAETIGTILTLRLCGGLGWFLGRTFSMPGSLRAYTRAHLCRVCLP